MGGATAAASGRPSRCRAIGSGDDDAGGRDGERVTLGLVDAIGALGREGLTEDDGSVGGLHLRGLAQRQVEAVAILQPTAEIAGGAKVLGRGMIADDDGRGRGDGEGAVGLADFLRRGDERREGGLGRGRVDGRDRCGGLALAGDVEIGSGGRWGALEAKGEVEMLRLPHRAGVAELAAPEPAGERVAAEARAAVEEEEPGVAIGRESDLADARLDG